MIFYKAFLFVMKTRIRSTHKLLLLADLCHTHVVKHTRSVFLYRCNIGALGIIIQQVAALWAANVSAFIGPQETCVHEGRMAAAFNLPMISYVRDFTKI